MKYPNPFKDNDLINRPHVCPNCGHCPTCGQSTYPQPYPYPRPFYPNPFHTTTGTDPVWLRGTTGGGSDKS